MIMSKAPKSLFFKKHKKMSILTVLKIIGASVLAYLMPIAGLLLLVVGIVLLDLVTGLRASVKKGSPITSDRFFNTPVKLFFYLATLTIALTVDNYVFEGKFPILEVKHGLCKILTMVYLGVEVISIDENSQAMGNKPFKDTLYKMLSFLKTLKKDLNSLKNDEAK